MKNIFNFFYLFQSLQSETQINISRKIHWNFEIQMKILQFELRAKNNTK